MTGWATVASGFAETARRYVEQVTVSLRPSTVKSIEHDLRQFGIWLADTHPEVGTCCADPHREHVEAFKTWLCTHPGPATGKPLNRVSIKNALINLHCFLTRITEWGYPNPPVRPLMFPCDLPIAAAKLLRTTRTDPDPLSRLIVETARPHRHPSWRAADPHRRRGRADRFGLWLPDPDRQTAQRPLHPAAPAQLKELLDDWITHHRNRPISPTASPKPCDTLAARAIPALPRSAGHIRWDHRGVRVNKVGAQHVRLSGLG